MENNRIWKGIRVICCCLLIAAAGITAIWMERNESGEGKYLVDKSIPMPEEIQSDTESAICSLASPKGELQVLTYAEQEKGYYLYTLTAEDKWEKSALRYKDMEMATRETHSIQVLTYSKTGDLYGILMDNSGEKPSVFVKLSGDQTQELPVKAPSDRYGGISMVRQFAITEDNHIVIGTNEFVFVSDMEYKNFWTVQLEDPGTEIGRGNGNRKGSFCIDGNDIYVYDGYHNCIGKYDTAGKEQEKISCEELSLADAIMCDGAELLLLNKDGIYSFDLKTKEIQLKSKDYGYINQKSAVEYLCFMKNGDCCYVTSRDGTFAFGVDKYYTAGKWQYDKTLRLYGDADNGRIREAIYQYSQANTNVKIELTEDRNQADVVVGEYNLYEQLSAQNKLMDMTDLASEIDKQVGLLPCALSGMQKDGKNYGLPVAITPYLYSTKEKDLHLNGSSNNFGTYLREHNIDVFGSGNYELTAQTLYRIMGNKRTEIENLAAMTNPEKTWSGWMNNNSAKDSSLENFLNGENPFYLVKIPKCSFLAMYKDLESKTEKTFDMLDYADIHTCVVIPGSCAEQQLAEDFVKTLYKKESQSPNLTDGVPVSIEALQMIYTNFKNYRYSFEGISCGDLNFMTMPMEKGQCDAYIEELKGIIRSGSTASANCQTICENVLTQWVEEKQNGSEMKVLSEEKDADGTIHLSTESRSVGDRFILDIILPKEYDKAKKYPVIYITDGYWNGPTYKSYAELMEEGKLKEAIIVGISYPADYNAGEIRNRDLYQRPYNFYAFLGYGVIPYMEEQYHADSADRTLAGSSCGGYFGLYALLQKNHEGMDLFHNYVICSPAFIHDTDGTTLSDYEKELQAMGNDLDANVFFAVGGDEVMGDYIKPLEQFYDILQNRKYKNLQLSMKVYDGEIHDTVWESAAIDGILAVMGTDVK